MPVWTEMEQQGLTILDKLENAGYEAFFVGGFVRDKVLGRPVKDIDIATSALPEEVVALFERTIPTGLKHGTVTVMAGGIPFEVTTYRKESDYADFRRPSEVEFISDLEEDLRRRDFTMNAMAMDRSGQIRDPFGGRQDMEVGILRCVGNPEERFYEDALRMLRCVRFAAAYKLEVDAGTWEALKLRRELLRHVAMERVRVELERTVGGPSPIRGWGLVLESGLLAYTKEPLEVLAGPVALPDADHSGWTASCGPARPLGDGSLGEDNAWSAESVSASLQPLAALEDPLQRWLLLMLQAELDPGATRDLLKKLTFSVKETERIAKAVEAGQWAGGFHWDASMKQDAWEVPGCGASELWRLGALHFGPEAAADWLAVRHAALRAGGAASAAEAWLLQHGSRWLGEMAISGAKELAISGKDLIGAAEGASPGPWVSAAIARLTRLAAIGRVANNRDALLEAASVYIRGRD